MNKTMPAILVSVGFGFAVAALHLKQPPAPAEFDHGAAADGMWHGKPGADIVHGSDTAIFLELHEQREVQLEFTSAMADGTLHFHVETDDGLMLVGAQTEWTFDLAEEREFTLPLTLYAAVEGEHFVHVFVDHKAVDQLPTSKALAQQVYVGEAELATHNYKSGAISAPGEISLPANETVY